MNFLSILLAAALAPLFPGIVNQTKAFFAGRRGPGPFRLYADLFKLLRKSSPRPAASTWVFDLAQPVSLASVIAAAAVFPWTGTSATLVPAVVFFYLLAAGRFFTVLGALDAGNAFEGMGASREAQFSALVEPVIFLVLGFLVLLTGETSLPGLLSGMTPEKETRHVVPLVLAAFAFLIAFLSETNRVPFDDPETHLDLTMIHEALLLDIGGPDLAFALSAAALKFELLAGILVMIILPSFANGTGRFFAVLLGIGAVSVAVGVLESVMARYRFLRTPQTLLGAAFVAALAVLLFLCF
jgi:formate hydrogenlyase subunit 4